MSKKNENKKEDTPKPKQEKLILYEVVRDNPTPTYIIVGALSLAGLLPQYKAEEEIYSIEDIEPSITTDELNKIIKNFIGE